LGISQSYTFESVSSIRFLDFHVEASMGLVFAVFSAIYLLCFLTSIKKEIALHGGVSWLFTKRKDLMKLIRSPLFALPLLSTLAYVLSKVIQLIQEFYNMPLGEASLPADLLLAFLDLSISPLIEELIFHVLPRHFLTTYFLGSIKSSEFPSLE